MNTTICRYNSHDLENGFTDMKYASFLLILTLLPGCASLGLSGGACTAGKIDSNNYPCWVNRTPEKGVVISMSQHIDPNKTREILFKKALLEIAAAQSGLEISEDSIVTKETRVEGNDNVTQRAQVTTLAVINTANGSVTVKAKIEDQWKHPTSHKLYMWVVPTE